MGFRTVDGEQRGAGGAVAVGRNPSRSGVGGERRGRGGRGWLLVVGVAARWGTGVFLSGVEASP